MTASVSVPNLSTSATASITAGNNTAQPSAATAHPGVDGGYDCIVWIGQVLAVTGS